MIIKQAKYKTKMVKQRVMVSGEVNGCDCCREEIRDYPNEPGRLEVTVFQHADSAEYKHLHYCSWKCVLAALPKLQTDYFISLPYLYYDHTGRRSASELIKILKRRMK